MDSHETTRRDSKSVLQFAALGAAIGVIFAVAWWTALLNGYYPRPQSILRIVALLIAPFADLNAGSDMPALSNPHDIRAGMEYLVESVVFNSVFYAILGSLGIVIRRITGKLLKGHTGGSTHIDPR